MSDITEDKQKKKTTFKTPHPEGVWDSIFRRLCELNYGCCCCASLRTGTLMFAWFFIFWFFLEIVGSVILAVAYNGWSFSSLVSGDDKLTIFHMADPFIYVIRATVQFCLSVVLLVGVIKQSNIRFNFIRIFVQSFLILITVGMVYEAAKFVAFVSLKESNRLRIYGSLLGYMALQGIYGWGTIVVKCYYVEISG